MEGLAYFGLFVSGIGTPSWSLICQCMQGNQTVAILAVFSLDSKELKKTRNADSTELLLWLTML